MKLVSSLIIKLLIVAFLAIFLLPVILSYSGVSNKYILVAKDVYFSLNKSSNKYSSSTLIIGDSVAKQLYDPAKTCAYYESLACNQAISLAGHYILLENYLKQNSSIKRVYLIYHPESFTNNLDRSYTFNYFYKPFYYKHNYGYFTTNIVNASSADISVKLLYLPVIRYTNMPLGIEGVVRKAHGAKSEIVPSDISIEYLKKIKLSARKCRIELKVIAPILSDKFSGCDYKRFKRIVNDADLNDIFENYFDFKYLKSSYFADGTHYVDPAQLGSNPLDLKW